MNCCDLLAGYPKRSLSWKQFCLMLTVTVWAISPQSAEAVTDLGTTTVNSIGHSFTPGINIPFPQPAIVTDYLVDQSQVVGGGAAVPSISVNLDSDTGVSYTISAPTNYQFFVNVPTGSAASIFVDLGWKTSGSDSIGNTGNNVTFAGLIGTAPSFPDNGFGVGNQDRVINFESETSNFTNSFHFSAVTFTTTYSPRSMISSGAQTYQPMPTNVFQVQYSTSESVDPGPFVSLVPIVLLGDFNFDGHVNASDIPVMMAALTDRSAYYTTYALNPANTQMLLQLEDTNGDGKFDNADLQGMLTRLIAGLGQSSPVPEPTAIILLTTGGLLLMSLRGRALFVRAWTQSVESLPIATRAV